MTRLLVPQGLEGCTGKVAPMPYSMYAMSPPLPTLITPTLQAKELLDHLEGVLSNKPVEIVGGQGYVEIKPQGVSKGRALERLLAAASPGGGGVAAAGASPSSSPAQRPGGVGPAAAAEGRRVAGGGPDFILCVGDDRSDEDMYTSIETLRSSPTMTAEVRAQRAGCAAVVCRCRHRCRLRVMTAFPTSFRPATCCCVLTPPSSADARPLSLRAAPRCLRARWARSPPARPSTSTTRRRCCSCWRASSTCRCRSCSSSNSRKKLGPEN